MLAEKKKIDETQTTATTNLETSAASTTNKAGKNISVIPIAAALAGNAIRAGPNYLVRCYRLVE